MDFFEWISLLGTSSERMQYARESFMTLGAKRNILDEHLQLKRSPVVGSMVELRWMTMLSVKTSKYRNEFPVWHRTMCFVTQHILVYANRCYCYHSEVYLFIQFHIQLGCYNSTTFHSICLAVESKCEMQNRDIEYVNWFLFLRYFHQLTSCLACVRSTLSNVPFIFDLRVKLNALYSHSAININKLKEEVVRWSFEAPWTSLCSDLVAVISHDEKKFGLLQTDWSTRYESIWFDIPLRFLLTAHINFNYLRWNASLQTWLLLDECQLLKLYLFRDETNFSWANQDRNQWTETASNSGKMAMPTPSSWLAQRTENAMGKKCAKFSFNPKQVKSVLPWCPRWLHID